MKILVDQLTKYEGDSLQTIEQAFEYIRAFEGEHVEICLHNEVYRLLQPINIPQDLHFESITLSGEERAKTVICGSQLIEGRWHLEHHDIYSCEVGADLNIDMLYVNGKLYHMARYPKYDETITILQGYAEDCLSEERVKGWSNPEGGYFHAIHKHRWGDFHYLITSKDENDQIILEGGNQNNRRLGLHEQHRYVENIFEELSAPGEWYYNKNEGKLYVIFEQGVDKEAVKIEAVVNETLFKVVGKPDKMLRNITFRNLTLTHTQRTFMKVEEPLLRSDWCIYRGGALYFQNAESCLIENCDFVNMGSNAVCVNGKNNGIHIVSSKMSDIAGNGICFIGETDCVRSPLFEYEERYHVDEIDKTPGPKSENYPKACEVVDCLITRTGRVEKQTAAIQVSMASQIRIAHCSLYELPRAAINFSEGNFGGHIIENCDIFDTVLETGDHGSFNSWGRDRYWGLEGINPDELHTTELPFLDAVTTNIIRNNRVRCDYGWDIDLDDGSSNYDIYNNLCLNGGIKLREGFRRKVFNNITVNNSMHFHVWYNQSGDCCYNNILFDTYKPIIMDVEWGDRIDQNIVHHKAVGMVPQPASILTKDSKKDMHSIICDCQFKDVVQGDYTVQNEEVLKLGFKNFDMNNFGVMSERLRLEAKTPTLPVIKSFILEEDEEENYWEYEEVTYKNITSIEEASAYGAGSKDGVSCEGVIVVEISPFLGIFDKGLRNLDILLKINDTPIKNIEDLKDNAQWLSDCKYAELTVLREQVERVL